MWYACILSLDARICDLFVIIYVNINIAELTSHLNTHSEINRFAFMLWSVYIIIFWLFQFTRILNWSIFLTQISIIINYHEAEKKRIQIDEKKRVTNFYND